MFTPSEDQRFWSRWKRGFFVLLRAYLLIAACYAVIYLPSLLAATGLGVLGQPWRAILGFAFFFGLLGVAIVYLPVLVSGLQINPEPMSREFAAEIEPQIDLIGAELGVQWEDVYVQRVEDLLKQGQSAEARRLYHDHSGLSWDEVEPALASWHATSIRDKLKVLTDHCSKQPDSTDPA